ncbi:MAG: putative aconitase subunit 2 [Proteobacteria bacterium]|nr:putative aconitase subunit 2 [Pseudomonadota bacterium]
MQADVAGTSWPAQAIAAGRGHGQALLLTEALSFWGGYDAVRGCVVESGHPQYGARLAGRVMLMERAKGSSSSSSVLAEAIRNGTGPAAIVMRERDLIVGLGCIVASELYGLHVPVVVVCEATWQALIGLGSAESSALHIHATLPGDCLIRVSPYSAHNGPSTTGASI